MGEPRSPLIWLVTGLGYPCYSGGMSEIKDAFLVRASAHARNDLALRPVQRWRNGVDDLGVAALLLAMEALGVRFSHTPTGQWIPQKGKAGGILHGVDTTATMREMIRTGLVRVVQMAGQDWAVIPARVHLRSPEYADLTACLSAVEGMREGRVRTVDDLALVDCLECEAAIAAGGPRGL